MSQFIRFVLVGLLNTATGYAVIFFCMYMVGLSPVLSNIIGYLVGLTVSYSLNRSFTFRSTGSSKLELIRFLGVFLVAYFANLGVLVFLIRVWVVDEGVAQILAGGVYVITFFLMNKYYVFRISAL